MEKNSNGKFLVEAKNVTKLFGYGFLGRVKFPAVDNVSFTMPMEPSIVTLAGESGSGKTTLARIILGLLEPSYGVVYYKGKNIYQLKGGEKRWFRKEIQAVFQDPFETFNPLRKVEIYLRETAKNFVEEGDPIEAIDKTLRYVELSWDFVKGKYPHEFSGGQLQRISLARALLSNPSLIIADEPVSMIDASMRMNIMNIFKDLKKRRGLSFIYITHDLATAYYVSDYIMIMYRGSLIEIGSADEVLTDPKHPYTQALVESIPEFSRRESWLKPPKTGALEIKEFLIPGCKYSDICPFARDKCREERPPLLEVGNRRVACWLFEKETN